MLCQTLFGKLVVVFFLELLMYFQGRKQTNSNSGRATSVLCQLLDFAGLSVCCFFSSCFYASCNIHI